MLERRQNNTFFSYIKIASACPRKSDTPQRLSAGERHRHNVSINALRLRARAWVDPLLALSLRLVFYICANKKFV